MDARCSAPLLSAARAADIAANPFVADFPLLAARPDIAYLDSAATAQRPAAVIEAEARFYETMNANPLRGLYGLSVEATAALEEARATFARRVGAADPREIVFTRNATESLNLVAKTLGEQLLSEGDEVCISILEHHSNLIPWQQICARTGATLVWLYPDAEGHFSPEEIEAKIGPATRIVSIAQVSNVLGVETPVAAIAERAHAMGAILIVDGAQAVSHLPVAVQELGCDLYAFSAHKALGPFGVGALWGRLELLESMPPFLTGGEMIDSVTQEGAVWAPVPEKFEAGTQDAAGIYASAVGLTYLEEVGLEAIAAREEALTTLLMGELAKLEGVSVLGPCDPAEHHGVVSFDVAGIHPHDVASLLDAKGVAIRAGHHCAQPLLAWLGHPSVNRASVAFYNDADDVMQLVDGLKFVQEVFHGSR